MTGSVFQVRMFCDDFCPRREEDSDDSLSSGPGHDGKGLPGHGPLGLPGHGRPLLSKDCACPCPDLDRDAVPARRLLSSSSSCASSLTAAEERELREVSSTS